MKIVIMASRFPYPLEKGDKLRLFHAIRILSEKHELHLIYITEKPISPDNLAEVKPYVTSFLPLKVGGITKAVLAFKSIFQTKLPIQVAWKYDKKYLKKINDFIENLKPDVVFCQLIRMSEYARHLDYPKAIDFMDAFSESMKKRSRVVDFPAKYFYLREGVILNDYENKVKEFFDAKAIISEKDARLLQLEDDKNALVISNGVDHTFCNFPLEAKTEKYDVGFVGNLSYLPNIHAIDYMYHNIYKNLRNLKFLVSGANPVSKINSMNCENFVIRGWIDDIRDSYKDISIFVAPIFAGTGQQNKILEAMAMGIPCITTTAVNDAIKAEPGKEIIIANTGQEFIESIKVLYTDKEKAFEIGKAGRSLVSKIYTWEKHAENLEKLFQIAIKEYDKKRNKV